MGTKIVGERGEGCATCVATGGARSSMEIGSMGRGHRERSGDAMRTGRAQAGGRDAKGDAMRGWTTGSSAAPKRHGIGGALLDGASAPQMKISEGRNIN